MLNLTPRLTQFEGTLLSPRMPPKARLTPAQAQEETHKTLIDGFFTAAPTPVRPGRPSGTTKASGRGRPPTAPAAPEVETPGSAVEKAVREVQAAVAKPRASSTRVNYSHGEPFARLQKAVDDFRHKTGMYLKEENMTLIRYSQLVEIPYGTLRRY